MRQPIARQIEFSPIGRTRVLVTFDEPELSSDGGALLLREAARVNGIIPAMAAALRDGRRQSHVTHSHEELLAERIVRRIRGRFPHTTLIFGLRETALKGTGMATATIDAIRLRLLKVAARVQTGRTFVRFHLPVAGPAAAAFGRTAALARSAPPGRFVN